MRYLLDTHMLSNNLLVRAIKRNDLFILREIAEEYAFSDEEVKKITWAGIQIVDIGKKHLERLKVVLVDHGDNFNLIHLYTNEGGGDILMISYILSEKERPETLFVEEYTLVTKDKELISVASSYGIKCIFDLPQ